MIALKGYRNHSNRHISLRQQVFKILDEYPHLTAKALSRMLQFTKEEYDERKAYLKKLRWEWKNYHVKERGSIRSVPDDVHNAFFVGVLPVAVCDGVRESLEEVWGRAGYDRWVFPSKPKRSDGWRKTKSRNRFLLFKNVLGRVRLFETGTVELYVHKPASLGRAMQLFCDAFTKTYLVTDIRVIEGFQKSLRIRRFHAVFDTDSRLPYMKIPLFKGTNGVEIVLGDRTHRHGVELIVHYQEQVEMARQFIESLNELFFGPKSKVQGPEMDYSR